MSPPESHLSQSSGYRVEARRMLSPILGWALNQPAGPGYWITGRDKLYRNGELAGLVAAIEWHRDPGGWRVTYFPLVGGPLDR